MAGARQLPCNADGMCMRCKAISPAGLMNQVKCVTCHRYWHMRCLTVPPETVRAAVQWRCPECTDPLLTDDKTTVITVIERQRIISRHVTIKKEADDNTDIKKEADDNTDIKKENDDEDIKPLVVSETKQPPQTVATTTRVKRAGLADASSSVRIFVTVPGDHFGPITAENDPERNRGVLVGDWWNSRVELRQFGVHRANISNISGQGKIGAQSVVLSGRFKDDEDHGEWFLYSGSGGGDLNHKRKNTEYSWHQGFINSNESLRVSCEKGYPVRVVRSYTYKRSIYAPQEGYRYDGIYRVEKCWRKLTVQGYMICRFLFVRCDNDQHELWTSVKPNETPRPLPYVFELNEATDIYEREESPSWDFDMNESRWKWIKPPPSSKITKNMKMTRNKRSLENFSDGEGMEEGDHASGGSESEATG